MDAPAMARPRPAMARPRPAIAGVLAVGLALAVGEGLAALSEALPSLIVLVGGVVVRAAPPGLTDLAIRALGAANVVVLQAGIVAVSLGLGAWLGTVAARAPSLAAAVVGGFAVVGASSALAAPDSGLVAAAAVAAVTAATGIAALRWLVARAVLAEGAGADAARRAFLRACGQVAGLALVAVAVGRLLPLVGRSAAWRETVDLPVPPDPLPAAPRAASLDVEGVTPLFTPNDDFYVVDTALRPPAVDPASWQLRIVGHVARPLTFTYDDLLDMATDEADMLLACVSNTVGGDLAGVARWQGIRLDALLERAGVHQAGAQVVGHSVDGFTAGFPTEAALDGRDALVAVAMNGEPLPVRHGFPARLVVAGLYGYVSATKWLSEIELAPAAFDAYWVPRGWAKQAPIKAAARIDVPRGRDPVTAGRVAVAGVAWAPLAGVAGVEVRVDEGPWGPARLAEGLGGATWRQWAYDWDAAPGDHALEVRAVDADGTLQTGTRTPPRPDGATGWHTVRVHVAA